MPPLAPGGHTSGCDTNRWTMIGDMGILKEHRTTQKYSEMAEARKTIKGNVKQMSRVP